ncbi:Rgg family transcriptional regulator [Vagococcus elongatus]|nr:Rgg/GadR/MutR family transcriptional regulator [Vagococcus elongatus]
MEGETFGEIFSSFRQKKGYTVKETAENIVSVQFLRRFEKGESDITLTNFYELLNRINVSFEEFMFESQKDSVDAMVENIEQQLDQFLFEQNTLKFRRLIDYLDENYIRTGNKRYKHISVVAQGMYDHYFFETYRPDSKELEDYLLQCETWGKYEFFLACYSTFLFNNETLVILAEQSFRRKVKSRSTRHYFIDFYLQVCQKLIRKDDCDIADRLLKKYETEEDIRPILQYLSFNVFAKYLRGLLQIKKGDERGREVCEQIINFFDKSIDYQGYASGLHRLYLKIYMESPLVVK